MLEEDPRKRDAREQQDSKSREKTRGDSIVTHTPGEYCKGFKGKELKVCQGLQPVRHRREEEPKAGLIRFYTDKKQGYDFIASFFDEPGNVHMRVCTPKKCQQVGFPFAHPITGRMSESDFRRLAVKYWTLIEAGEL